MFIDCNLKSGVTLVELMIYVSLLGLFASQIFSWAWQMHAKDQQILVVHTQLNAWQTALELLARDLRLSKSVEIEKLDKKRTKIVIKNNKQQTVYWKLKSNDALIRQEQQIAPAANLATGPKIKFSVAKVADGVKSLTVVLQEPNVAKIKLNQRYQKIVILRHNLKA
jgi:type II secretory pathway component PulJ